jgi:hypothetical protein
MLCRFHHRQVHEGQVDVRLLDDGALRFINANGKRLEAAQSMLGDTAKLLCEHRRVGIAIAPTTAVTGWCGELIDYPMAVEGLLFSRDGQAETLPRERRTAVREDGASVGHHCGQMPFRQAKSHGL